MSKMWRKALIAVVCLLSSLSVAYVYSKDNGHNINAASNNYRSGGETTGRVNILPNNITSINAGLQKGDKIYMETTNPLNNDPLSWILLKKENYNDYGCTTAGNYCNAADYVTAWLSMTTEEVANTHMGLTANDFIYRSQNARPDKINIDHVGRYTNSNIYNNIMIPLNQSLTVQDRKLIAPRNLNTYHDQFLKKLTPETELTIIAKNLSEELFLNTAELGANLFLPDTNIWGSPPFSAKISANDAAFSKIYWSSAIFRDDMWSDSVSGIIFPSGSSYSVDYRGTPYAKNAITDSIKYAVRPAAYLDIDKVVFSVSQSNSSGIGKIVSHQLPSGYTNILDASSGDIMKVRLENETLTNTTAFNGIQNANQTQITKAAINSTVYLDADAKAGNDGCGGVYTVSAIVFDQNNQFKYYLPLESAKGNGLYEFDLTGIPIGSYKIGIVNEAYNENSTMPADSSLITDIKSLEIVESLVLSVNPLTGLEVGKNVNQNDVVTTYTTRNGVAPITATVVSDTSVSGHENDYQLFSLNNGNVIVNDANGLNAGDYYFKINAIDSNGAPVGGVNSTTVHIVVGKTNLTVAFDDSTTTKKSIAEATSGWNETATANPSDDVKITYSKVGGDIGLIDIDADTGAITYKGNGAYGKVKIRATADDDSSSGNDNYNSAFAEKEIVIYAQVNGSVTPHADSSDISTPTFTANDSNVKINGTIGTIKGSPGTPDDVTGNRFTYTYGLKSDGDGSFFAVNASTGVITTKANLAVGSYSITVTVSDKWSTKEIPVTINVGMAKAEDLKFYENSSSNVAITTKSAKATDTNVTVYATVKGSSNSNPVKYKIKDGSTNIIEVNEDSGAITIHGVGTVTIVAEKQGGVGQATATAELTFTVTPGTQNFIYTDNAGNELPKDGNIYKAYSEVYAPNKTFQLYTAGNPTGSTVNYQLKAGSPTDVISVDNSGLVTILNASLNNQMGKVIVQATSHDPTGNYSDKTIELPINIEKGTRTISFKEKPIYVTNGKGKVTPVTEVDGVVDTEGDVLIEVDNNEDHTIAWTNDNKTIDYNYSGDTGKDIKIYATKPMNRNYKAAEADGTIHIMGPDENILAITSPGQIIYGDHFTIRSSQYDADSTNVQYTFEVDKTTYISNPTINGNSAEFDAKQFSGSNKTTITVTRTADGETMLSKQVQVTVLPKPIEITIDDKEKLKGEINPTLTYQDFRSDLVSWNGVQDVIQENDIKLSTTAKTDSNAGAYPIKGDSNSLNKTYPNYSFKFKEGTLNITEENIEDDWYHLELDDGNNTAYTGEWTNKDVNIISDHNEYINLSLDQSTWNPNQVTISREGETNQSFWMKKDSGAITKEKQEIIKIDKTAPKVKGIKAKDTNNKLQDIINKLSGGIFFKPGTAFEITTDDSKDNLKVSGTKEIAYKVYKSEPQARAGDELIKAGTLTVTKEKASITISETTGTYKVCVIPTDNAGNTNTESCHEVTLKKINVDVDGDGKPDFNDPDGDGCPDLNIVLGKDDDDFTIKLNIDNNGDGIPELNIDTNGDGLPDINVDTDDDGKPDLNIATNIKWNPTHCVTGQIEEYCTDSTIIPDLNIDLDGDGRPDINVDLDGDGIPDIDIDTDGDGKPDINIDTDKDGKPDENIKDITEWKPNDSFSVNGKDFNTMTGLEPDPEKPNDADKPKNPTKDDEGTDVKGSYYPGDNVGGAITGDSTNMMLYICLIVCSIGAITYLIYKNRKIHFNK